MNAPVSPVTIPHTPPGMAFSLDAKGNVILYWSSRRAKAAEAGEAQR